MNSVHNIPDQPHRYSSPEDGAERRMKLRSAVDPIPVLDQAEAVQVQIEMLKETYDEIMQVIREQEMDEEEGLLTVMLSGLGYMDAKLRLEGINEAVAGGGAGEAERIHGLVQDLASYHSMYSVLKYKTFKLYKLAQKLEFNVAGLRATEFMWEEWANRMRRERAEMQAEITRLRALASEFKVDGLTPEGLMDLIETYQPPPPPAQEEPEPTMEPEAQELPEEPPSLWKRLMRLLGGD